MDLKKFFHIHRWKPIHSKYWTFCHRIITYECKCGKRKEEKIYRSFDRAFPIPTNHFDLETEELLKKEQE